jgi:Tfp pilus assembly protein PilN
MHINFVMRRGFPLDLKGLKQLRFDRLTMAVMAGGVLLSMLLYGGAQRLRLELLMRERADIERRIGELRKEAPLEETNLTNITQKDGIFASYDKRVVWADVLKDLTNNVTSGVWLEGIKSGAEKKGIVVITGQAVDQGAVAEFIRALQEASVFKEVRVESSTMSEKEKRMNVAFILECVL